MPFPLPGLCNCGFVRYEVRVAPIVVHGCHCRDCQRDSGTAFAMNAMIEAQHVVLTGEGVPEETSTPSSDGSLTHKSYRCPRCKTELWSTHARLVDRIIFVRVGTLKEPAALPPTVHCFTRSKLPWIVLPDGVPAYDADYDHDIVWGEEGKARFAKAMQTPPS